MIESGYAEARRVPCLWCKTPCIVNKLDMGGGRFFFTPAVCAACASLGATGEKPPVESACGNVSPVSPDPDGVASASGFDADGPAEPEDD